MTDYLGIILGGGGVAFLAALFKGLQMWRDGTEAREQKAIAGLERWRRQADQRADRSETLSEHRANLVDYWRSRAGLLEYELYLAGRPVPPAAPIPQLPAEDRSNDDPAA